MKSDRSTTIRRLALLLALAATAAMVYAFDWHHYFSWVFVREHLTEWKTYTDEHLLYAIAIYVGVYLLVTSLSLPLATVLTLVGGALFGRWLGVAAVSLASTAGATLAFWASRYVFSDFVRRRFAKPMQVVESGFAKDGVYYVLALRLVPAFPFFLVNIALGLTPISTRAYVLASWLAMLPATFLYVNAGTELANVETPAGLVSTPVLVSLGLLGIAPLLFRWLLRPRASRAA